MQVSFKKMTFFVAVAISTSCLFSCEKDEGKLPDIAFKTGGSYLSADKIVAKGETVTVGITADKTEDKDVLKTFNVSASFDGAANSTVSNTTLTSAQADHFEVDVPVTARNQAGTEKYTFTVTNRDGLVNSVSLTLTVQ
mgnify:CR=1 FL=1